MKEVGKIRKIFKGFFPDETVSDSVKEIRRAACSSCSYNSANTPSDKLSSIDYLRSKITPAFCTLCKCQIFEKTQSPLEECAAYMAGHEKKWFKTRLETVENNNINITNVSDTKADLQLINGKYVVDYGKVDITSPMDLELILDLSTSDSFKLHSVNPTCGCSAAKYSNVNNQGMIQIKVNVEFVGLGKFAKPVYVEYIVNNVPHKAEIVLTGFKI